MRSERARALRPRMAQEPRRRCNLPPSPQSSMLPAVMKRMAGVCAGLFGLTSVTHAVASEPSEQPPSISLDSEADQAAASKDAAGASASEKSDHQRDVGRLSLAFHGTRVIPAVAIGEASVSIDGTGSAALHITPDENTVPLFGVRYWVSQQFGIDAAVGIGYESGSYSRVIPNPNPALDRTEDGTLARRTNLALRLAAPLSIYSGKHYNLMVIPSVAIGYSRALLPGYQTSTTGTPLDLRLSGLGLGVGVQLGSELSFGFLGAPQLSLQTAWGLRLESQQRSGKIGDAEAKLSDFGIGTSFAGEPWQWLTGSLSLFYRL